MRKFIVETLSKEIVVDDIDGVIQATQSVENDPKDTLWFIRYGDENSPEFYLDETLFAVDGYARTHGKELMEEMNDALDKAFDF